MSVCLGEGNNKSDCSSGKREVQCTPQFLGWIDCEEQLFVQTRSLTSQSEKEEGSFWG